MPNLIAIDVAILPPAGAARTAIEISAALQQDPSDALRLDDAHLPHVTLSQQFVRTDELPAVFDRVGEALRSRSAFPVRVTGGGGSGGSLWLAVEETAALMALHEAVMKALQGLERAGGPAAFFDSDARLRDVLWVAEFRLKSSFGAYTPHITVGHAPQPPDVEPFTFEAAHIAVCHLGRFCTCRRVLGSWTLPASDRSQHLP